MLNNDDAPQLCYMCCRDMRGVVKARCGMRSEGRCSTVANERYSTGHCSSRGPYEYSICICTTTIFVPSLSWNHFLSSEAYSLVSHLVSNKWLEVVTFPNPLFDFSLTKISFQVSGEASDLAFQGGLFIRRIQ